MAIGRTSLLWVEGNTNGTTPTVTSETTYNVDQPAFWTPLSVLSGLASGYCERRAVIDSTFKTGNSTSAVWIQGSTAAADVTTRAAIVSNCMHNMALGSAYSHLFYNADATMAPIGSAAGTASNYMTSMDGAITALLDTSASTHYVTPGGSDYANGFSGVASSAFNRASAAASAITMPTSGGGSALKTVMGPGLPVEWAKERKWMLDELRYTGGAPAGGTFAMASAIYADGFDVRGGVDGSNTLANIFSSAITIAEAATVEQHNYGFGLTVSRISSDNCTFVSAFIPYGVGAAYTSTAVKPGIGSAVTTYIINGTDPVAYSVDFYALGVGNVITIGTGQHTSALPAGVHSSYKLLTGATVTLTGNGSILDRLDVASGATAYIGAGITSIGACNEDVTGAVVFLDGGTAIPTYIDGHTYSLPSEGIAQRDATYRYTESPIGGVYLDRFYYQTTGTISRNIASSMGIVIASGNVNTNNSLDGTDPHIVVSSGGTFTVTNGQRIYATALRSGGSCMLSSGHIDYLYVEGGATATIRGGDDYYTNAVVYSGGVLTIESGGNIGTLYMEEGAQINVTGATLGTDGILYANSSSERPTITTLNARLFNRFQIPASDISAGSQTPSVISSAADHVLIYGATTATKAAVITGTTLTDLADYNSGDYGTTKVGTTTLGYGYSFCDYVVNCNVTYGYHVGAYYGSVPGAAVQPHYTDFFVRQFATDPTISTT